MRPTTNRHRSLWRLEQRHPQDRLADEFTQHIARWRHHCACVGIAEQPFDGHVLCERCSAASPHRGRSDGDGYVSSRHFSFEDAQHRCVTWMFKVVDQIVNTCGKTVSVDLHRGDLRAQGRQAFAEALTQMLNRALLRWVAVPATAARQIPSATAAEPRLNNGSTTCSMA